MLQANEFWGGWYSWQARASATRQLGVQPQWNSPRERATTKGAPLAQCGRNATIWVPSRTGDPYFVILGASLLPLAWVLMLLPHGGYGIFGIFTNFHPFPPLFTFFLAHLHHGLPHFGVGP